MRFLFIFFAFLGCVFQSQAAEVRDWGLYIYAVGDDKSPGEDDKLEGPFWDVLMSLKKAPAPANTHITIQFDRSYSTKMGQTKPEDTVAARWNFEGREFYGHGRIGETNTGDPKVFYNFLKWSYQNFPAKKIILLVMSHGSGVLSWSGPTSSEDGGDYDDVILNPFTAYDGSHDSLTIFEFRKTLDVFKRRFKETEFEALFFANCLNGMLEAASELKGRANYMLAAPTFSYSLFDLSLLYPAFSGEQSFQESMYATLAAYQLRLQSYNLDAAFQLYNLNAVTPVEEDLNALAELWLPYALDARVGEYLQASKFDRLFYDEYYGWLDDIVKMLVYSVSKLASPQDLGKMKGLRDSLIKNMKRAVRIHAGSGKAYNHHSFAVFWPQKKNYNRYLNFYKKLEFSKNGKFDEVLQQIYQPSRAHFQSVYQE